MSGGGGEEEGWLAASMKERIRDKMEPTQSS